VLAQVRQQQQQAAAAEQCLQHAAACLQETVGSTRQDLPLIANREALFDKAVGLFIDLQVLLMEVLEAQAALLQQLDRSEEAAQCSSRADAVAAELTGGKK
jgi:hypothetical protein